MLMVYKMRYVEIEKDSLGQDRIIPFEQLAASAVHGEKLECESSRVVQEFVVNKCKEGWRYMGKTEPNELDGVVTIYFAR